MSISRAKNPILHFDDINGHPLCGGLLYTYLAGTTTKVTTYNSLGKANTNPVVLNARGEADVWLDTSVSYKFVLKRRIFTTEVEVYTADNVTADTMTYEAKESDTISVSSTTSEGKTVTTFSVADNSIGRTQLKNAKDLIVDPQHLKMLESDGKMVLSLSDKLAAALSEAGFELDDVEVMIEDIVGLQSALDAKSAVGHTHDGRYYTESEVDSKLSEKASVSDLEDETQYRNDGDSLLQKALEEEETARTNADTALDGRVATLEGKTSLGDFTDNITTSTYSSTGTQPVNGTAVASAISTKQDTITTLPIAKGGTGATTEGGAIANLILGLNDGNTIVDTECFPAASSTWRGKYTFLKLWTYIKGKADSVYAALSHTHTYESITDKPSSFTPSAHTHAVSDVTGLQDALDGKLDETDDITAVAVVDELPESPSSTTLYLVRE